MKAQYCYRPHGRKIGIYKFTDETKLSSSLIKDVNTIEEAKLEVYRLNGWSVKKIIRSS